MKLQGIAAKHISLLLAAAAALCGLLPGCRDGSESSVVGLSSNSDIVISSASEDSAEAVITAEQETETAVSESIDFNNAEAETAENETLQPVVAETAETDTAPIAETSAPVQTTEIGTPTNPDPPLASEPVITTAATTTAAPVKQPAEIVIPDVKTVSSPGISVLSSDNVVIDYSNASLGYISVTYSGSSDKAKLRMVCGGKTYDHDVPVDGKTYYFPLSCGSGEYQLQFYEHAYDNLYAALIDDTLSISVSDEVSMFLYPNRYVSFTKQSDAVAKGAEVCAGMDGTLEKIAAIFVYITDNITYDKQLAATVTSGYVPDPDSVLAKKSGICFDYSSLFAAMARSQGIPTRLAVGYASPDIYHAWNEVYTEETGWITPELYLAKYGYNLLDATFYAGAADKAQVSEYISDAGNYSVVYYY